MIYREVYEKFKNMIPFYSDKTISWTPNGKNSIKIILKDGKKFIFTYSDKGDWILETIDHFINRTKGVN